MLIELFPEDYSWRDYCQVYRTDNPNWLIKIWQGDDQKRRNEIEKRYRTFCRQNFQEEGESLGCLPQEYVTVCDYPAYVMRRSFGLEMGQDESWQKLFSLSLVRRLRIGLAIVKAITKLHSRRIVHADIRPSNLCFYPDTAKVEVLDLDGGGCWGQRPGGHQFLPNVCYASLYMPPELKGLMSHWEIAWEKETTKKQPDLWALAILLYQIITKQGNPFTPKSEYAQRPHPDWPKSKQLDIFAQENLPEGLLMAFKSVFCRQSNSLRADTILWKRYLEEAIGLFAAKCAECGAIIEDTTYLICPRCIARKKLVYLWGVKTCGRCGAKMPRTGNNESTVIVYCPQCGKKG